MISAATARVLAGAAMIGICQAATMSAMAATPVVPKQVYVTNTPDATPFAIRRDITMSNGSGNGTFVVPAGKRLVIDYISADAGVPIGGNVLFDLATYVAGAEVESHLPMVPQGVLLGQQVFSMSAQTTVYADAGSTVTIAALYSGTGSAGMIVGVYGHLIPSP